jgi:hypothetical protein
MIRDRRISDRRIWDPRIWDRHRLAASLGVAGSVLGVIAGTLQATIGPRIPEWTGAKAAPIALGLLTIGLSALAGCAAVWQRRSGLSVWARAGCAFGLIAPGLLCLSTVGRLWYPSAILMIAAGILTIDSWKQTATAIADDWLRVLLSALGGFELLMAAGSSPVLMAAGTIGGIALIAAAWLRSASRWVLVGLIVVGTVPFAVLAWTAVVPLLLAVLAIVIAVPIVRPARHRLSAVTPRGEVAGGVVR